MGSRRVNSNLIDGSDPGIHVAMGAQSRWSRKGTGRFRIEAHPSVMGRA